MCQCALLPVASSDWTYSKNTPSATVILTRQGHPCAGMTLRAVLTMRRIAPLTGQTRAWTRCARPAAICTGMPTARARSGRRARTPWTPPRTLPSRPSALHACLPHAARLLWDLSPVAYAELAGLLSLCCAPHLHEASFWACSFETVSFPSCCVNPILKGNRHLQGHCCGRPELHWRAPVSASIRR